MKGRRFVISLIVVLILTTLPVVSCRHKRTPMENLLMENLKPWWEYLEDYKRATMCYPQTWDQLVRWKSLEMPENPFTGEPIRALESSEFDPETSPGNIYYIKVEQDDCVINCQVIIFGEKGELTRYSHAGPLAPT